jgi:hypothetical protein
MCRLRQVWDTLQVLVEALAEISLSTIGKLANPHNDRVPIHCTIVQKPRCERQCL